MRRPRIGIPLCQDDRGRWRPGSDYLYIDRRYAQAIDQAGGRPLQLPIQSSPEALIDSIDGLLLPGGDDLRPDPERGEAVAAGLDLDWVPEEQRIFDCRLLRAARASRLPVLAICYGMQLLAREGGGKLHIHLPTERPEAQDHKLAASDARHSISIEAESRLARAFGSAQASVNSLHHQAVAEVGPEHRVVARSSDGVIEAIEAPTCEAPYELGVQWHPEKLDSLESRALFEGFVSSCRDRAIAAQDG